MAEWGPAFQYYPSDFEMDTAEWDIEHVGLYQRLLNVEWTNGSLPDDTAVLARLGRIDHERFISIWNVIKVKFYKNGDGRLYNKRMEEIRLKQLDFKNKKSKAGKKGMDNRWHNKAYNKNITQEDEDRDRDGEEDKDGKEVVSVIENFNKIAGTNYKISTKSIRSMINARLGDGYTAEDCIKVIRIKTADWKGTEMEKYLRPSTLFRPSKFPEYLNQKVIPKTMYERHDEHMRQLAAEQNANISKKVEPCS